MRVAALAFGVLAGLVASLILALGGLDVSADLGAAADRQAQAIRFGLFVIGNLGIFGAALALAAPLAGGIFLLAGAAAWVGAALLMHHSTDLVLITPPALLAVAAVFAIIAHFRRPRRSRDAEGNEDDVEVIPPLRARRDEEDDEEEDVGLPAFAAAEQKGQSVRNAFNDDPTGADEWNPRKKQPPPPRTKPSFRPIEEEYDEDDEPSGFSRFAMGLSGLLSFGLYAALAGAAVLIFWNMRNDGEPPAVSVAEAPAISSSATLPPASSSEPAAAASSEQSLQPILTGESIRQVDPAGTAPSTTPSELVAATATSQEPSGFGSVTMSDSGVPTLANDFSSDDEATPLGEVSGNPPSLPAEEASTEASSEAPAPVELETAEAPAEPTTPTVASGGQLMPRTVPASMAALRTAPGTGPTTVVVRQPSNSNNTGL